MAIKAKILRQWLAGIDDSTLVGIPALSGGLLVTLEGDNSLELEVGPPQGTRCPKCGNYVEEPLVEVPHGRSFTSEVCGECAAVELRKIGLLDRIDNRGSLTLTMGDLRSGVSFDTASLSDVPGSKMPVERARIVLLKEGARRRILKDSSGPLNS